MKWNEGTHRLHNKWLCQAHNHLPVNSTYCSATWSRTWAAPELLIIYPATDASTTSTTVIRHTWAPKQSCSPKSESFQSQGFQKSQICELFLIEGGDVLYIVNCVAHITHHTFIYFQISILRNMGNIFCNPEMTSETCACLYFPIDSGLGTRMCFKNFPTSEKY